MALKMKDRHRLVESICQAPDIPATCRWALFLRNHDELTLDVCMDAEREQLYSAYAQDPRMRLNDGIRTRLAPLLENDRIHFQGRDGVRAVPPQSMRPGLSSM